MADSGDSGNGCLHRVGLSVLNMLVKLLAHWGKGRDGEREGGLVSWDWE